MLIHTSYFFWAMLILFITTVIFYIVAFSLINYWKETKTTVVILPLIYTFEYFTIAFLVLSLISLVLQYLPDILRVSAT